MTTTEDIEEIAAWLQANAQRVPRHRRLQVKRLLERAEALVPAGEEHSPTQGGRHRDGNDPSKSSTPPEGARPAPDSQGSGGR